MAMDLIRENIEFDYLYGENLVDSLINDNLVIPDTQPDVTKVLLVDATPTINSKEVLEDKINVSGVIDYNVMYLAKEDEKSKVYNVKNSANFNESINISGLDKDMESVVSCYIEHIDCSMINERKLGMECILKLKGEAYKKNNLEYVSSIEGNMELQKLTKPGLIHKVFGKYTCALNPKISLTIPQDKDEVGKILNVNYNICKKDVKILENRILVNANVCFKIFYKTKDKDELILIEDMQPVSCEIDAPGVNENMIADFNFSKKEMNIDVNDDDLGEKRLIQGEATIECEVKVFAFEEINMIEDAYSPNVNLKIDKKDFDLGVWSKPECTSVIVKDDMELEEGSEKPKDIKMYTANANITDKKLLEGKVAIEGVVNVKVLYSTDEENESYESLERDIPFSTTIDVPGAKIDMKSIAKVSVESMDAVVEGSNIAIKAVLEVCAMVSSKDKEEFLVDVAPVEGETPAKKASLTIYVVQHGDTLWKIAKKYYTTVDEIIRINSIENPDSIKPGMKIIIPGRALY